MTILSDEEVRQFKRVLEYSQDIPNPKVEELLATWEEKKSYFIKKWGGPIYEIPNVTFTLDASAREERINVFLDRIERKYKVYDLVNFIELNRDGFYNNEVITDKYSYNGIEIPKGMKLVKAFKYFLGNDKCVLTDIQNDASRVIQEDKIDGTLCFSVHPMDFISASENTHNWRSCHALDGEYRGGNLSYMVDECTFMCYLRSAPGNVYELPNFPDDILWNSKKWRIYLYLSLDKKMLMAGRQYPFASSTGMKRVLEELFIPSQVEIQDEKMELIDDIWELFETETSSKGKERWSDWRDDYFRDMRSANGNNYHFIENLYPVAGVLKPLKKFVKDLKGSLQYNDLLYSTCYTPMYSFLINNWHNEREGGLTTKDTKFKIGGKVPCLNCGEHHIAHTETLVCEECYPDFIENEGWYCENCDCHMDDDDDSYYVEGSYICERCFIDSADYCMGCGLAFFEEHLHYVEENGEVKYYCDNCWEERNNV